MGIDGNEIPGVWLVLRQGLDIVTFPYSIAKMCPHLLVTWVSYHVTLFEFRLTAHKLTKDRKNEIIEEL